MNKTVKIKDPIMPNYIQYDMPPVTRQMAFNPGLGEVPIGELSENEALEYAELMKTCFIAHWESKRHKLGLDVLEKITNAIPDKPLLMDDVVRKRVMFNFGHTGVVTGGAPGNLDVVWDDATIGGPNEVRIWDITEVLGLPGK